MNPEQQNPYEPPSVAPEPPTPPRQFRLSGAAALMELGVFGFLLLVLFALMLA